MIDDFESRLSASAMEEPVKADERRRRLLLNRLEVAERRRPIEPPASRLELRRRPLPPIPPRFLFL
jgi:hypothetical protein